MRDGSARRSWRIVAALATAVIMVTPVMPASGQQTAGYILGPEDVLEVTVWGYPDLTRIVTVRPDGKISLPTVGPLTAAGLSVERLTQILTRAYAAYINNPQVTVSIREFRKIRVSVLGQVTRPGTYVLPPGSRLLDLRSDAGGRASRRRPWIGSGAWRGTPRRTLCCAAARPWWCRRTWSTSSTWRAKSRGRGATA